MTQYLIIPVRKEGKDADAQQIGTNHCHGQGAEKGCFSARHHQNILTNQITRGKGKITEGIIIYETGAGHSGGLVTRMMS